VFDGNKNLGLMVVKTNEITEDNMV